MSSYIRGGHMLGLFLAFGLVWLVLAGSSLNNSLSLITRAAPDARI